MALGVRIIGRVHQDVVPQKAGDAVEHVLPFVHLDAAEEPPAGEVLARLVLQGRRAPHVAGLFVHTLGPEWQPAKAALQDTHP